MTKQTKAKLIDRAVLKINSKDVEHKGQVSKTSRYNKHSKLFNTTTDVLVQLTAILVIVNTVILVVKFVL